MSCIIGKKTQCSPIAAIAVLLALHASPALCATDSRSVVLVERDGQHIESTRYDPAPDAKQYWADPSGGAIRKSDLAGGPIEEIANDLKTPYGIAFDRGSQRLVWTNAGDGTVQALDPNGKVSSMLTSSFEEPFAIDISDEYERAYYSVQDNIIYRHSANIATGEESSYALLIVVESEPIHGLALDPENGALYIGDYYGRMTRKLDLRTQRAERLSYVDIEPALDPGPGKDSTIDSAK